MGEQIDTYWKKTPHNIPTDITPTPNMFLNFAAGVPLIFLGFHFDVSTPMAIFVFFRSARRFVFH